MTCRTWWIMAMISFAVGILMTVFSFIFRDVAAGVYFVLLNWGFVFIGWVLWGIGLVNYWVNR